MGPTRTVALSGLGRPLFLHCTAIVSTVFPGSGLTIRAAPAPIRRPSAPAGRAAVG